MATAAPTNPKQGVAVGASTGRPKGGYPLEIFERQQDRDKYACAFCRRILREPMQAFCGHRFCETCQRDIEESYRAGQTVLCKLCKEEGCPDDECKVEPKKMHTDKGIRKEMGNIIAKCPNAMCIYGRPFKEYINHEPECKFQPQVCDKCGELVSRQKMDQHKKRDCPQRSVKCHHCEEEIPFAQKKNHVRECPQFPETCSQCNRQVPREKVERHQRRDCPERTVVCPVEECVQAQPLSRYQQHVQKEVARHLAWVVSRAADLDATVAELTEATSPPSSGEAPPSDLAETLKSLTERLGGLEGQLQDCLRAAEQRRIRDSRGATGGAEASASTDDGGGPHKEQLQSMELKVNSLEPIISVLHAEMNRCITVLDSVMDQLRREGARTRECEERLGRCEGRVAEFAASPALQDSRIEELQARLSMAAFGQERADGTLLWRIPNFSQVRKDAVSGKATSLNSRPFFTGPIGYKMVVRLFANGDGAGKGTHLSFFVAILRGPYDALLPWPFRQVVYLSVVDQNLKKHAADAFRPDANSSFQRPTSDMNTPTGFPRFMPLTLVSDPSKGYLKDDTLFVRLVVSGEGLDQHLKQFDPQVTPGNS